MFDDLTSTQSLLLGTIAAFVFSYLIHMFFSKSKLQVDGQVRGLSLSGFTLCAVSPAELNVLNGHS